jgi:hypothetical protein
MFYRYLADDFAYAFNCISLPLARYSTIWPILIIKLTLCKHIGAGATS